MKIIFYKSINSLISKVNFLGSTGKITRGMRTKSLACLTTSEPGSSLCALDSFESRLHRSLLSAEEPSLDFSLETLILELLLSEDLLALLASSNQVGHNLFSGPVRQVLDHVEFLVGQGASDLV